MQQPVQSAAYEAAHMSGQQWQQTQEVTLAALFALLDQKDTGRRLQVVEAPSKQRPQAGLNCATN